MARWSPSIGLFFHNNNNNNNNNAPYSWSSDDDDDDDDDDEDIIDNNNNKTSRIRRIILGRKMRPYCDPTLLTRVLEFGLEARSLHVGASPNDCSEHSTTDQNNIPVIQVETSEGRAEYKQLQSELMARTDPIREQLLANCKAFTRLAFTEEQLMKAALNPSDEQFAKAEPGGLPWKQNLIDRNGSKTKEEETKRRNM